MPIVVIGIRMQKYSDNSKESEILFAPGKLLRVLEVYQKSDPELASRLPDIFLKRLRNQGLRPKPQVVDFDSLVACLAPSGWLTGATTCVQFVIVVALK